MASISYYTSPSSCTAALPQRTVRPLPFASSSTSTSPREPHSTNIPPSLGIPTGNQPPYHPHYTPSPLIPTFLPLPFHSRVNNPFYPRPAQQAGGAEDEAPDYDLVLVAVALEAGGDDVFFFGVFADGEVVFEAEGAVALGAGGGGGSGGEEAGGWVGGGGVVVEGAEGNDGAVCEAGAFAESWGGWTEGRGGLVGRKEKLGERLGLGGWGVCLQAEAIPRRSKMVERRGIGFMIGDGREW